VASSGWRFGASSRRGIALVDLLADQTGVIAKDHLSGRGQADKPRRQSMDDSEAVECHVRGDCIRSRKLPALHTSESRLAVV